MVNGKQFTSIALLDFLCKYSIQHVKTAFYLPQTSAAERVNRSILHIIRSYTGEDQKTWDIHLSDAAFALESMSSLVQI